MNFGGNGLAAEVRRRRARRGPAVVFPLHNFEYGIRDPFGDVDALIAPSRFAAAYYRKTLGIECEAMPNIVDLDRVRAEAREPRYVTFVNPSGEKGVYAFGGSPTNSDDAAPTSPCWWSRAAGRSGRLYCGLDLRGHGNVSLMGHTPDPRQFWGLTKICLMPSLWWESQGLVAIEAMANGIPVLGSDRGAPPETLGDGGLRCPSPRGPHPGTRELPTASEVAPWVRAIIGLWDDPVWYEEQSRRALGESRRWLPDALERRYVEFFGALRPPPAAGVAAPSSSGVQGDGPGESHAPDRFEGGGSTRQTPSVVHPFVFRHPCDFFPGLQGLFITPVFNGAETLDRHSDPSSRKRCPVGR